VILIVGITVGAQGCSHKDYPFLCMVAQFFHRWGGDRIES